MGPVCVKAEFLKICGTKWLSSHCFLSTRPIKLCLSSHSKVSYCSSTWITASKKYRNIFVQCDYFLWCLMPLLFLSTLSVGFGKDTWSTLTCMSESLAVTVLLLLYALELVSGIWKINSSKLKIKSIDSLLVKHSFKLLWRLSSESDSSYFFFLYKIF